MKFLYLWCLIFFSTTLLWADSPTPTGTPVADQSTTQTPTPSPSPLVTFQKLDPSPYGNRFARRAEISDSKGLYKVYIDQITDPNHTMNSPQGQVVYHYQILKKNKLIAEQDIQDAEDVTDLLPDSHLFSAKISITEQPASDASSQPQTEQMEVPMAVLVFKRDTSSNPFKIICVTTELNGNEALNVTAERYEFTPSDNDPNEEIVTYDRFNTPTHWSLSSGGGSSFGVFHKHHHQTNQMITSPITNRTYYFISYHQLPPDPAVNQNLQNDLEAKLKDPSLDSVTLFFIHAELAQLYSTKSYQNPSPLDTFGQMATEQIEEAMDLQPQFPLKDTDPSIQIPPFTFLDEVGDMGKVNGMYGYKLFRMTGSGRVEEMSSDLIAEAYVETELRKLSPNNNNSNNFINNGYPNGAVSPTGLFRILIRQDRDSNTNDEQPINLQVTDLTHGNQTEILVPDLGNGQPLGWDTGKDLYYFFVSQRLGSNLWQFDPVQSQVKKIGYAYQNVYLSPDGKWILWGNGGASNYGQNASTSGLNAFSVEKGVSYRLTHTLEPKYFVGWETTPNK